MGVSIAKSAGVVNVAYEGSDINLLNQSAIISSRNAYVNNSSLPVMCRYSMYLRVIIPPVNPQPITLSLVGSDSWSDLQITEIQVIGGFSKTAAGVIYLAPHTAINYETRTDGYTGTDPICPYDVRIIIEVVQRRSNGHRD